MCLPHPTSPGESISLNFAPLAVKVSLLPSTSATPSEVSAYTADSTELTQADVDAAAALRDSTTSFLNASGEFSRRSSSKPDAPSPDRLRPPLRESPLGRCRRRDPR